MYNMCFLGSVMVGSLIYLPYLPRFVFKNTEATNLDLMYTSIKL